MQHHLDPHLVIANNLTFIDIAIVIFFVAIFLVVPKLINGRSPSLSQDNEYILMSRSLNLPFFVATLVATWYGGIFGVTQIAFNQGVYSFFTQGLFWYVAYFIFAIVLVKKVRRYQVLSLPELVGKKFGWKARKFAAVILFLHALPITYGISVGILLNLTLGLDFFWAMTLGVLVVTAYTSMGGFRSVVITDGIQFVLMFFAVIILVVFAYIQYGGIDFLQATLPPHYFQWESDKPAQSAVIWLFIACTTTFIHPVFYQRCLAARTDRIAFVGILIAMGFWLLFDLCTTLGGMYARALIKDADSASSYLILGMNILPIGIKGLFLSGVLATILSTLDSFIFVSGTAISYDLWPRSKFLRGYQHHIGIILSACLVLLAGQIFQTNFEATWLFVEGAFSSAMLTPVMAAVLMKRRFSNVEFIVPTLLALTSFAVLSYARSRDMIDIEPFYLAHLVAFLSFAVTTRIRYQSIKISA